MSIAEPIVSYNSASINSLIRDEIIAAFVDIETKIVKVDDVIHFLNGPKKLEKRAVIPVFLMYTNEHSPNLDYARQLPHADILQKPLSLEIIFKKLTDHINLNDIEYEQFSNQYKLDQFKKYAGNLEDWLEKFGSLLDN